MKSKTLLTLLVLLVLSACQKKDINALRNEVNDLKSRVTRLEDAAKTLNTDIASLKTIATALQAKISVVSYAATANGYELTMSDGSKINLVNGKDGTNGTNGNNGKDGINAPLIGLKQDADANYYWTIGGDWLLQNGQKIKANGTNGTNGTNGASGITPLLMVNATSNQWMVSYDNGNTWSVIKDGNGNPITATGPQGPAGQTGSQGPAGPAGVPGFSITETDTAIVITYGGNTYTLPKGGNTNNNTEPFMIFEIGSTISKQLNFIIDADLIDKSGVWVDINNDGIKNTGENVTVFGTEAVYNMGDNKIFTIYGKVKKIVFDEAFIITPSVLDVDVSNNPHLVEFTCKGNLLTKLDLSRNKALRYFNCSGNYIKDANMSNFLKGLPQLPTGVTGKGKVYHSYNFGLIPENNSKPQQEDIDAAAAKGWTIEVIEETMDDD